MTVLQDSVRPWAVWGEVTGVVSPFSVASDSDLCVQR